MNSNIIILIVVVVLVIYVISTRNHFVNLKNDVETQLSNISNYKEMRTKYLKDALGIAKISNEHEIEGIAKLTAEDQYDQLMYLGQKYPQLASIEGYNQALSKVYEINQNIASSKVILNGNVNIYNKSIQEFPANIIAKIFKFEREQLVDEENMAANRSVDTEEVDISKF